MDRLRIPLLRGAMHLYAHGKLKIDGMPPELVEESRAVSSKYKVTPNAIEVLTGFVITRWEQCYWGSMPPSPGEGVNSWLDIADEGATQAEMIQFGRAQGLASNAVDANLGHTFRNSSEWEPARRSDGEKANHKRMH